MFKQILVGVDGGAGGRDAIALAKLIVAAGGELTLAHVVPGDDEAYGGAGATYDAPDAEGAEALLEKVREEQGRSTPALARIVLGGTRPASALRTDRRRSADHGLIAAGVARAGTHRG